MGGRHGHARPAAGRVLPDIVGSDPRVLFVGINPGVRSAALGHHYAGPGNRFWRLLHDTGLVSEPLTWREDRRVVAWGLGLTNLVHRTTPGVAGLRAAELAAGRRRLLADLRRWRPRAVALVGVTVARHVLALRGQVSLGRQPMTLVGRPVFVLPNPSGRNAHYRYEQMLAAFRTVRQPLS